MTNAPTTRETADHAELARTIERLLPITCRDTPDYAEVSFGECQAQAMTMEPDTWLALNQLPALLSEIAALRGERDGLKNRVSCLERLGGEQSTRVMEQATRAKDAERQRDEAVELLRRYRSDLPTEALEDLADAFIANQGAD